MCFSSFTQWRKTQLPSRPCNHSDVCLDALLEQVTREILGNDLMEPWNVLETPRILLQCFCNLDALDAFMNAPSTWKSLSEVAVLHFYGKTPASRDCRFEFWDRAPRRQEYEKAYYTGDSWVQPFCQPVSQVGIASAAFIGLWLNTGAVQQGVNPADGGFVGSSNMRCRRVIPASSEPPPKAPKIYKNDTIFWVFTIFPYFSSSVLLQLRFHFFQSRWSLKAVTAVTGDFE